jgi:6,7-dimethyl-8-ribityllumazine synthase
MLRKIATSSRSTVTGRFAIVASRYNARYVNAMLRAARKELTQAGVKEVEVIRVPGAFEIPVVVTRLIRTRLPRLSAVIALGVILRGETAHAQLIAEAVNRALAEIQVQSEIPAIHAVLLLENEAQARVRCLGSDHNRGREAAQTALAMAQVMSEL